MQTQTERLLIIACGALAHDLIRIKRLNRWEHMDVQCLPADYHNKPQLIPAAVEKKIRQNRAHYTRIYVGYADCGTGGLLDAVLEREQVERLPGAHCYEMFAGSAQFNQLHEAEIGTFYLTDYLAQHFDRLIIRGLGLDRHPELKADYFRHYKKLVYLAQLEDEKIAAAAQAAAEYLGLEYQLVATGDRGLHRALHVRLGTPAAPA